MSSTFGLYQNSSTLLILAISTQQVGQHVGALLLPGLTREACVLTKQQQQQQGAAAKKSRRMHRHGAQAAHEAGGGGHGQHTAATVPPTDAKSAYRVSTHGEYEVQARGRQGDVGNHRQWSG